jgi:hypothetical protein
MSWRTTVNEQDLAGFTTLEATEVGGFVINARRGLTKPRWIETEQQMLTLFGQPNSTYWELLEVLEYIKVAPAYVSAPFASDALYGGVAVTSAGLEALSKGISDPANVNFSQFPVRQLVGTGDVGGTTTFVDTLSKVDINAGQTYVNQSLTKLILTKTDGTVTEITLSPTDAEPEDISSVAELSAGSQVLRDDSSNGTELTLIFATAPEEGETIEVEYQYIAKDIRFVLFGLSPATDVWLGARIVEKTAGDTDGVYTVELAEKNGTNYVAKKTYELSMGEETKNVNGKNVYISGQINDRDFYLTYAVNTNATAVAGTIAEENSYTDLEGGDRGTAITDTERNNGWAYFQTPNAYAVDVVVETSGSSGVVTSVVDIVDTYQKYKAFAVIALPYGESGASALISTKSGLSVTSDQVMFVANWGEVENKYTGVSVWSSLVGRTGANLANMANVFNSLSPAGTNENGIGGELGTGIIQLEFDFTDAELKSLDDAQINPNTFHPRFGYLLGGDRTANTQKTDTAYVGTRRLINLIIYEVKENILLLQEFKTNDSYHRRLFEQKVNIMAQPILAGDATHPDGFAREIVPVCDNEDVNAPANLERREFVANIIFKAMPNSQRIIFNFIRIGQTVDVNEFV